VSRGADYLQMERQDAKPAKVAKVREPSSRSYRPKATSSCARYVTRC